MTRVRSWLFQLLLLIMVTAALPFGVSAEPTTSAPASQPTTRRAVNPDLVKKLLGGESSTLDTVDATLSDMKSAASRITDQRDVGQQTQQTQRRIVAGIDQLIEQARKNNSSGSQQQSARRPADPKPGGQKPQQTAKRSNAPDPGKSTKGGMGAPGNDKKPAGSRADEKAELTRGWGFLPLKDRHEVSQGFDEEFLGKYREEIIRYYRDLAQAAEKNK